MALTLLMESDNTITMTGLQATTGFLNAATVTWKITRVNSTTAIGGASGTMTYVTASDGNYSEEIDATVVNTTDFEACKLYWGWYTAVEGNFKKTWRCDVVTQYPNDTDG